jgi:uncharacterized membrane protein
MVPAMPLAPSLVPGFPLVRWLHVLGAAVAVGGAVATWALLVHLDRTELDGGGAVALSAAAVYEWLFWGALGLLVMTGVGNLGAFAPSLPRGRWGITLDRKLLVVVLVLVGSVVRTFALDRCRRGEVDPRLLRRGYAGTALALVVVVGLAEVLAHG